MKVNFREHPRGGVDNKPFENNGEPHLACVVLLDTSESMQGYENQLRKGLKEMHTSLSDQAMGRVEFCIINFDDEPHVLEPFGPAYEFKVPEFDCAGMTSMHQAIDFALNEMEIRKRQYKSEKIPYYRPWIYMLTDGEPTDDDNGAFDRLIKSQEGKHCVFFPVAIGNDANLKTLGKLNKDGVVLKVSKESFVDSFRFLSDSVSKLSESRPGEKVQLANTKDYNMEAFIIDPV